MAITYKIDQVVDQTGDAKVGQYSVYVLVYDDEAPDRILARTCVQGADKAGIKAALAVKLPAIKQRLAGPVAAYTNASAALAELISEEKEAAQ